MRLTRIANEGKILNQDLYERLKKLDYRVFHNCGDEFKKNRDWWVIVDKGSIVGYCGSAYSEKVCIFVS